MASGLQLDMVMVSSSLTACVLGLCVGVIHLAKAFLAGFPTPSSDPLHISMDISGFLPPA